jgi:hypothetical protein
MARRTDEPLGSRSRADARRRARLAARGEIPDDEPPAPEEEPQRGGFLRRIFPPVPPLPNRPDPLAGREFPGPLGFVRERLYLLRINPLAWLIPAALWFASRLANPQQIIGLLASLAAFAGLIGAGWFGWQRPGLYGATAAVIGFLGFAAFLVYLYTSQGIISEFGTPVDVVLGVLANTALQGGLGYVSGWYGGYLRRRQAQIRTQTRGRR